jgi:hypothetical protein
MVWERGEEVRLGVQQKKSISLPLECNQLEVPTYV